MSKYEWLEKKTPRSVDQLRLWTFNPRLNPEEEYITLSDFAEELTNDASEKKAFYDLVKSIVAIGFIQADPIVVWQNNKNNKYYVAEGNRRVLALKLLRYPEKAPKSIRSFIRNASNEINRKTIEKILVNVAPTFSDAEWYINQRNSLSSLQRRWSRVQQQRWVTDLYYEYNGDLEIIKSKTNLSLGDLEEIIRVLKIRDFIKMQEVKNNFTQIEYTLANSHKFPITILERFFNFTDVRRKWGIKFNGIEVEIISNKSSFYIAFSELIKRIIDRQGENKINTRMTKVDIPDILASLPTVTFDEDATDKNNDSPTLPSSDNEEEPKPEEPQTPIPPRLSKLERLKAQKGDTNRNRMVLEIYKKLYTDNHRINVLFNAEFQKISVSTYPNTLAAALRVFLDLSILQLIDTHSLREPIGNHNRCNFKEVTLHKRLSYLKDNLLKNDSKVIAKHLLQEENQFSLRVLNGYVHSKNTHYLDKRILNGFWDFLFPLFEEILDIREKN